MKWIRVARNREKIQTLANFSEVANHFGGVGFVRKGLSIVPEFLPPRAVVRSSLLPLLRPQRRGPSRRRSLRPPHYCRPV